MKTVGIVVAWEPELEYLFSNYPLSNQEVEGPWTFNHFYIGSIHIVAVVSGVGKVKSASCTQLLITKFKPCEMYMTGICGGVSEEFIGGEIIVGKMVIQHDVTDAGKCNDPIDPYLGRGSYIETPKILLDGFQTYVNKHNIQAYFGTIASGDQRIRDDDVRNKIRDDYNAIAVDQETAAFAHVCYINNVDFLGFKCVSDKAGTNTVNDQKKYKKAACEKGCEILIDFIEYIQRRGLIV